MSKATHLECSLCGNHFEAGQVANLCTCGGPLLVKYDLDKIRHRWLRRDVPSGPASMWRYAPVLPPSNGAITSLGEGWTPLVQTKRLGARLGSDALWVKDEGMNPTATLPARWPHTPRQPESSRTSLCRKMCRRPITWSAKRTARM